MRIDRALIQAAMRRRRRGIAETIRHVILPLVEAPASSAISSIFVITIVMGDFVTVNVLGGGKVASIGKSIATESNYLQFPPAAANAIVLLLTVIMMILALGGAATCRRKLCEPMLRETHPRSFVLLGLLFALFVPVPLWPDADHHRAVTIWAQAAAWCYRCRSTSTAMVRRGV